MEGPFSKQFHIKIFSPILFIAFSDLKIIYFPEMENTYKFYLMF